MLLVLLACAAPEKGGDDTAATPEGEVPVEVVHLTTEDGVTLEGDFYAADPGDPGVLLLHMSPLSGYDRTVWPGDFIGGLREDGFAVLAIDRRGAGASEGDPAEAAAEAGVYDARAAVDLLLDRAVGDVSIVGASSGTTTTLDYTVTAPDAGYPDPAALVFMSGGSYTEAQHGMEELTAPRLMLTWPETEAAWNEAQRPLDPGTWRFEQYPGDLHAALILPVEPRVGEDIRGWLRGDAEAGDHPIE
jgi:pimeloyl-ACP methyl ester carboxylesterase